MSGGRRVVLAGLVVVGWLAIAACGTAAAPSASTSSAGPATTGRAASTPVATQPGPPRSAVGPGESGAGADAEDEPGASGGCVEPLAVARITTRDPDDFWTVTGLEGAISNPSDREVQVSTLLVRFRPGVPPGVSTAELTVPLDVIVPAGGTVPWRWTGSVVVRPFHDDAPQPEVDEVEWTGAGASSGACPEDG